MKADISLYAPKPGEVRNPNGRPKGARNASTVIRELMAAHDKTLGGDGNPYRPVIMRLIQAMSEKATDTAATAAAREILDRLDGKATQTLEQHITTENEGIDLSKLSDAELEQLRVLYAKAATNADTTTTGTTADVSAAVPGNKRGPGRGLTCGTGVAGETQYEIDADGRINPVG